MNEKSKATLKKFKKELRVENYSSNTINTYCCCIETFLLSFCDDIYHIPQTQAVEFLKNKSYSSISQQNQYISAIKLLYKHIVGSKLNKISVKRPRKEKRLPKAIDESFLKEKINTIDNLKHKAILHLTYSTGMRRSEIVNLKIDHIDGKRKTVTVVQGKGNKDRIIPISNKTLKSLREYFIKHKPKECLFNGQGSLQYSAESCNKLVKKYIGSKHSMHQLRHSFATHLVNRGVDLAVIGELLGHENESTTKVYAKISVGNLSKVIDLLD